MSLKRGDRVKVVLPDYQFTGRLGIVNSVGAGWYSVILDNDEIETHFVPHALEKMSNSDAGWEKVADAIPVEILKKALKKKEPEATGHYLFKKEMTNAELVAALQTLDKVAVDAPPHSVYGSDSNAIVYIALYINHDAREVLRNRGITMHPPISGIQRAEHLFRLHKEDTFIPSLKTTI